MESTSTSGGLNLYLSELDAIFKKEGLNLPPKLLRRVLTGVMELYESKDYHKAILFKNGLLASAIVLGNYDYAKTELLEAFIKSNHERHPPQFGKLKWDFKNNTECMNLNEGFCRELGKACDFIEGKKYPLCEIVYKSLQEAIKSG